MSSRSERDVTLRASATGNFSSLRFFHEFPEALEGNNRWALEVTIKLLEATIEIL
jgi:hypothetical protein